MTYHTSTHQALKRQDNSDVEVVYVVSACGVKWLDSLNFGLVDHDNINIGSLESILRSLYLY